MKLSFEYDAGENCKIATIGNLYRVHAEQDTDAESPRAWDNVATMVCEHRRYTLGDDNGRSLAINAIRSSRDYRPTWEETESGHFTFAGKTRNCFDFGEPNDVYNAMLLCGDIVVAPLYLYDHSGITISTGRFSCPWDSGQVGFAFVTLATIRAESGKWSTMCKPAAAWARATIDAETDVYDDYLTGSVYGWILERATAWDDESYDTRTGKTTRIASDWEHVESCSGYYGSDHDKSGLAETALDSLQHDIATRPPVAATERAARIDDIRSLVTGRAAVTDNPAARDSLQRDIARTAAAARSLAIELRAFRSLDS